MYDGQATWNVIPSAGKLTGERQFIRWNGTNTDPDSCDIVVDTAFDAYDRPTKQTMPYAILAWVSGGTPYRGQNLSNPSTQTSYDILGRKLTVTAPDGTYPERYTYIDLEVQFKDARDKVTRNLMDIWGRTTQVNPPTGPSVTYTYNQADQLTQVVLGDTIPAPTTTMTYDALGRKLTMVDPDMGTWTYTYDALNLTRQKDAKNQRICFYYDLLNRLTGKHYRSDDSCPGSYTTPGASYVYDAGTNGKGQRTSMTDASGSTTWTYDVRGRLISETKSITGSGTFLTQWGYNSGNQLIWMKYPGNNTGGAGEQVNFGYLPQNIINSVSGTSTYVQGTTYDAASRVDVRTLGSGLFKTDYDYFAWTSQGGRLRYIKSGPGTSPTSLQYLEYSYDSAGNVTSIKDYDAGGTQTQTFAYDDLQRLTSASALGGTGGTYNTESYVYNSTTGNLSSKAGVSYTYGAQAASCADGALNKPHAVVTAGSNTYCYDKNGNMNRRVIGSSTYNLTYDAEIHLAAVSGATSATFVYDGDGNRVKATVGSTTTAYLGNYFEWTGSTSTMKKYYYAGSTRVAVMSGTTLSYLLGDHLGSTAYTINTSAIKTGELRYKAWGENRYTSGTTPTSMRFTGQRQESTLGGTEGLYFYGSRWYDPH